MNSYAALLGHQPRLTLAELAATLPDFTPIGTVSGKAIIFESKQVLFQPHLEKWGGTMLLAQRVIGGAAALEDIPKMLVAETAKAKGKVTFAIRSVGVPPAKVRALYRDCKEALVKAGRSARYIGNEKQPAATIQLHQEGLLDGTGGCEIVILQSGDDDLWIGRTVAAQDPDAYTMRDMEKPVRDTRVGLLPPKLAQIMLNFGLWAAKEVNPKKTEPIVVYDPFCGTGVIPIECLHRGWPVFASDVSAKAVTGTEKNLEWIRKKEEIKKKDVPSRVWKQDARKPFEFEEEDTVDVIVTETHLGPALSDRPLSKDAGKMRSEVDALEVECLENAAESLPGVPLVVTFPVWFLKTGTIRLERVWKTAEKLGYEAKLPEGAQSDNPDHPTITYRRPDQFVGREIVVFVPKR